MYTYRNFEAVAAIIKRQDVVLTSDDWKIVLNIDTRNYDRSLTELRAGVQEIARPSLYLVHKHELEQINNLLNSLEEKLTACESLLPRSKSKYSRGLFDMGGKMLKYVFGVATVQAMQHVSSIVKELDLKQDQISHSVFKGRHLNSGGSARVRI
jgi:hypothetical protein